MLAADDTNVFLRKIAEASEVQLQDSCESSSLSSEEELEEIETVVSAVLLLKAVNWWYRARYIFRVVFMHLATYFNFTGLTA
jgi:hypothetical protein